MADYGDLIREVYTEKYSIFQMLDTSTDPDVIKIVWDVLCYKQNPPPDTLERIINIDPIKYPGFTAYLHAEFNYRSIEGSRASNASAYPYYQLAREQSSPLACLELAMLCNDLSDKKRYLLEGVAGGDWRCCRYMLNKHILMRISRKDRCRYTRIIIDSGQADKRTWNTTHLYKTYGVYAINPWGYWTPGKHHWVMDSMHRVMYTLLLVLNRRWPNTPKDIIQILLYWICTPSYPAE